ncbi:hypothetical protein FVA96_24315, partial [Escherichia coli]|nr:hypothetical protein [Escherichia coli]
MTTQVGLLNSQVEQILTLLSRNPAASPEQPPTPSEPPPVATPADACTRLAPPERYSGTIGQSRSFIIECEMHFEHSPMHFPTERSKVAFMMSHLTGRAKAWATAEWARSSAVCSSPKKFADALRLVFDPVATDRERARELSQIKQGGQSVCEYAIRFRTLAMESGWNPTSLYDVFLRGLSDQIQDLLVPLDLPLDLDSLIALAIRTDNRLQERRRQRGPRGTPAAPGSSPTLWGAASRQTSPERLSRTRAGGEEEPMQMGRARLSQEERQRRYQEGRCFYCGERGHLITACPVKANQSVSQVAEVTPTPRRLTTVRIKHRDKNLELGVLIDSGADESLIDWGLAQRLGLRVDPLSKPVKASALNGSALFTITHVTEPVELRITNHWERIQLYLIHSPLHHLILGFPWLIHHNPHINWRTGDIMVWGEGCRTQCRESCPQGKNPTLNRVVTHPVTDSEITNLTQVPSCYHHLAEVFSKSKATALPPHRP